MAIATEEHLEDLLSEPPAAVVEPMGRLTGDVIVFGVSGKNRLANEDKA